MIPILDKKEFYKLLLKDRLPVAKIEFPAGESIGRVEFINTPIGTLLRIYTMGKELQEIKMYNRSLGDFALQNVFCGQNLIRFDDGSYITISGKLQIEDVIGRSFLIKLENINIVARAEFVSRRRSDVDKSCVMVYN